MRFVCFRLPTPPESRFPGRPSKPRHCSSFTRGSRSTWGPVRHSVAVCDRAGRFHLIKELCCSSKPTREFAGPGAKHHMSIANQHPGAPYHVRRRRYHDRHGFEARTLRRLLGSRGAIWGATIRRARDTMAARDALPAPPRAFWPGGRRGEPGRCGTRAPSGDRGMTRKLADAPSVSSVIDRRRAAALT